MYPGAGLAGAAGAGVDTDRQLGLLGRALLASLALHALLLVFLPLLKVADPSRFEPPRITARVQFGDRQTDPSAGAP